MMLRNIKLKNILKKNLKTNDLFLKDTLAHFSGTLSGGMNWYAFNEPDPSISNDPVRGGEYWSRFIKSAPNYYLIKDEQDIIQRYASQIGTDLPSRALSVDLGPGNKCAIMGKTMPFNRALKSPIGFRAVDVNSSFAQDAAAFIKQQTGINSDYIVGDFLNNRLNISHTKPTIFSLFGGLLCNSPKDSSIDPVDQLALSFEKLGKNMNHGDYLVITQDTNQNKESLMRAYTHPDMGRYILSVMHKIKRDLPTENFDPDMFEFVPRWNKEESLLSLNARVKREYGVPTFKIAGIPFALKMETEIPLVNSYKLNVRQFIFAAKRAALISEKICQDQGDKIALHVFKYMGKGKFA